MKILIVFLLLISCSNSDTGNISYGSSSEARSSAYDHANDDALKGENEPEIMKGGTGITIGNGHNNDAELDEEVSQPEIIIGAYLACHIFEENKVSCQSNHSEARGDLAQLILVDRNNQEIPLDKVTISEVTGTEYLIKFIITVPGTYELDKIESSPNNESDNQEELSEESTQASSIDQEQIPPSCKTLSGGIWIRVPADSEYAFNDFCVMKYEAKCTNLDGQGCSTIGHDPLSAPQNTPWVSISQDEAMAECASLGTGYHLISNDEWMAIASNIAAVASNWSVEGELARGHSDSNPSRACEADVIDANSYVNANNCIGSPTGAFNQRRTHNLSNGEVIWDLAGNVWEWTSFVNSGPKPTPVGNSRFELTGVSESSSLPLTKLIPTLAISSTWNSANSIGQYYPGGSTSGGSLTRGGNNGDGSLSGIFSAQLNFTQTARHPTGGFRCAYTLTQ